jgi:hypothetical protein
MAITYEQIVPPIIENTVMQRRLLDGEPRTIQIAPIEGYVLHDNNLGDNGYDPILGMPTDEILLGYKEGEISVAHDYNFIENPRELYAVSRSSVDKERIF